MLRNSIAFAILSLLVPFVASAAIESKCTALGDACLCSEPFDEPDPAPLFNEYNPPDSSTKQCGTSVGVVWSAGGTGVDDAQVVAPEDAVIQLPVGHSMGGLFEQTLPTGGSMRVTNQIDYTDATYCVRYYRGWEDTFPDSFSKYPNGSNCNDEDVKDFHTDSFCSPSGSNCEHCVWKVEGLACSFHPPTISNWNMTHPGLGGWVVGSTVEHTDCRNGLCRIEHCFDHNSRAEPNNDKLNYRLRVTSLKTGEQYVYGPNISSNQYPIASTGGAGARNRIGLGYPDWAEPENDCDVHNGQPAGVHTYFTHYMTTKITEADEGTTIGGIDIPANREDFWPGGAPEVEGTGEEFPFMTLNDTADAMPTLCVAGQNCGEIDVGATATTNLATGTMDWKVDCGDGDPDVCDVFTDGDAGNPVCDGGDNNCIGDVCACSGTGTCNLDDKAPGDYTICMKGIRFESGSSGPTVEAVDQAPFVTVVLDEGSTEAGIPCGDTTFFTEDFESGQDMIDTGWYNQHQNPPQLDGTKGANGSSSSLKCSFNNGSNTCIESPRATNHKLSTDAHVEQPGGQATDSPTTDKLYIGIHVTASANWVGSNGSFHPHIIQIGTNERPNGDYGGLAATTLTGYFDIVQPRAEISVQDSLNSDDRCLQRPSGAIEGSECSTLADFNAFDFDAEYSIAGCNGHFTPLLGNDVWTCFFDSSYPAWDSRHFFLSQENVFTTGGQYNKTLWHFFEVYYEMNSIFGGAPVNDGKLRMRVDGNMVISRDDVVFRNENHPNMEWKYIVLTPFIGAGSPTLPDPPQVIWFDDMTAANGDMDPECVELEEPPVPGTEGGGGVNVGLIDNGDGTGEVSLKAENTDPDDSVDIKIRRVDWDPPFELVRADNVQPGEIVQVGGSLPITPGDDAELRGYAVVQDPFGQTSPESEPSNAAIVEMPLPPPPERPEPARLHRSDYEK